jgi:hypothetical protein
VVEELVLALVWLIWEDFAEVGEEHVRLAKNPSYETGVYCRGV